MHPSFDCEIKKREKVMRDTVYAQMRSKFVHVFLRSSGRQRGTERIQPRSVLPLSVFSTVNLRPSYTFCVLLRTPTYPITIPVPSFQYCVVLCGCQDLMVLLNG